MSQAWFSARQGLTEGTFLEQNTPRLLRNSLPHGSSKKEPLRAKREQFTITPKEIVFNVGKRLKHAKEISSLNLVLEAPYMNELLETLRDTKPQEFSPIVIGRDTIFVRYAFKYPTPI
jgi:hypothetical protein